MIVLVYDTETTGFTERNLPATHPSQPDLVQMGAILYDDQTQMVRGEINLVVAQDEGVKIPSGASDVHGIKDAVAAQFGLPLVLVMATFNNLAKVADAFVCHNAEYDLVVAKKAYHKVKRDHQFNDKPSLCTLELLKPIMKLPPSERMRAKGMTMYKSPSLMEAYRFVTGGKSFEGAHDASADVHATVEIWKWLKEHQHV